MLFDKRNQILKIKEMNDCCLFMAFSLKFSTALIVLIAINSLTC